MKNIIEALQILATKGEPKGQIFAAEHDVFYIYAASMDFTEEEFARLKELNVRLCDEFDCFMMYC